MPIFVAVDTGGTFTDLVALDPETGALRYTKSLTTHSNPIEGIVACLDKAGVALAETEIFKHGTTLVINTLLERSGPNVALVTTAGFRDVVELGRGSRTEPFNLSFERSKPLVARQDRYEIQERMAFNGTALIAPEHGDVVALADRIRVSEAAAVAVSFLNSYRNPAHERQVADWLRVLLPERYVTCGTDLTREWHEYERSVTAVANAYAGPEAGRHFERLTSALGERGFDGELLLMSSSGGVLSAARASAAPVLLVESGPVGGCIGAAMFAKRLDLQKVVAFDMGGTTAKCNLIEQGKFDLESTYYVGGYGRGIPIRAPVLDIVEVGAGGGSIAWVDPHGGFHVGPRSAGSAPGPVAYGKGGTEPTVTDANLMLGRINAANFQGGEMTLDVDGSAAALSKIAEAIGYDAPQEVAKGILAIANVTMAGAIKRVTVKRGKDPREFVMFAYGGGGPLHGADLARSLRIPIVIIPPEPSNFSAVGMLLADLRLDSSRTFGAPLEEETLGSAEVVYAEMEAELQATSDVDMGGKKLEFQRDAELRFVGQSHAVRIQIGDVADATRIRSRFHTEYRARYGHVNEDAILEIVALHLVGVAKTPSPGLEHLSRALDGQSVPIGRRMVHFVDQADAIETPVYRRSNLPPGWRAQGPAVIEEYGSTTIIGPFDDYAIGSLGEIVIEISRRSLPEN